MLMWPGTYFLIIETPEIKQNLFCSYVPTWPGTYFLIFKTLEIKTLFCSHVPMWPGTYFLIIKTPEIKTLFCAHVPMWPCSYFLTIKALEIKTLFCSLFWCFKRISSLTLGFCCSVTWLLFHYHEHKSVRMLQPLHFQGTCLLNNGRSVLLTNSVAGWSRFK